MQITNVIGREILDSRGNPTVEAVIEADRDIIGQASVPSGASTGSREAYELRDNNKNRYLGKGVLQAVDHINQTIRTSLLGYAIDDQSVIDETLKRLDGTKNKSNLGANAILAVSLAVKRAYAHYKKIPLYQALNQGKKMIMPVPMMNVLNGGAHADNKVDIQEFMIMPIGANSFAHAVQMGAEIFHHLKQVLRKLGLNTAVGDEGGFAPDLQSNRQALDLLAQAIENSGYKLGTEIVLALDVAASELFTKGKYHLASENRWLTHEQLVNYYQELLMSYPIVSIEDGMDEQDHLGWLALTQQLGKKVQLVGDDLFVTNAQILQQGIKDGLANAVLIKPNQIGTLTETLETIALAQQRDYKCIISHRSGETEDSFIADLAVATGTGQIKTGSLCRSDRVAKYNQLLRINAMENFEYANLDFNS